MVKKNVLDEVELPTAGVVRSGVPDPRHRGQTRPCATEPLL